jgi:hypothetical protein
MVDLLEALRMGKGCKFNIKLILTWKTVVKEL